MLDTSLRHVGTHLRRSARKSEPLIAGTRLTLRYLTDDLQVDKSASWGEMKDTRKGVVAAENLTRAWNMNELSSSRNGLFILLGYIVSRPKKQHHRTGPRVIE